MLRGDELAFHRRRRRQRLPASPSSHAGRPERGAGRLRFTPNAGFVGVGQVQVSVDDLGASGSGGARSGSRQRQHRRRQCAADRPGCQRQRRRRRRRLPQQFPHRPRARAAGRHRCGDQRPQQRQPAAPDRADPEPRRRRGGDAGGQYERHHDRRQLRQRHRDVDAERQHSIVNYQKVLRTVTYNNSAATPTPTTRSVTFVAFDGSGDSNIATANVTFNGGVDTPPVAGDDVFVAIEEQALSAGRRQPARQRLRPRLRRDLGRAGLRPVLGTLASFAADGSFSYVPAAGFNGIDSFSYRASSGGLDSGVATVTIAVGAVNDAPRGADAHANRRRGPALRLRARRLRLLRPRRCACPTACSACGSRRCRQRVRWRLGGDAVNAGDFDRRQRYRCRPTGLHAGTRRERSAATRRSVSRSSTTAALPTLASTPIRWCAS